MPSPHSIVVRLTEQKYAALDRRRDLQRFAESTGWKPSDEIEDYPGTEDFANGHLLVEHGLDNAAVISFLRRDRPYEELDTDSRLCLLSISYNNLVDWHLLPDSRGLTIIFNRTRSAIHTYRSRVEEHDVWQADSFELVTAKPPPPDFKALDDTLIETIRFWKKALRADLGEDATNERISALFNTLIFIRVMEDTQRGWGQLHGELLLEAQDSAHATRTLTGCVTACIRKLGHRHLPKVLRDCEKALSFFDGLDEDTLRTLLRDFYFNRYTPYKYDFSLISKHALGRIYESYVSLLKETDSPQLQLFKDLPEEVVNRTLGGVYTPQYIARFFARFLREHLPPRTFRNMATIDPACGSGMFLRTLLEMQCDTLHNGGDGDAAMSAFRNTVGIDVDPSACKATELSLSLLHFGLTRTFPKKLTIHNAEAIEFVQKNSRLRHSFDAIIANPPFVKWDSLHKTMKARVTDFMAGDTRGKCDLFLTFIKLGLQLLRPGGHLLYVLPHSFLIADNARQMRDILARDCWIHVVADLSEIPVFEGLGSYVILLIAQKRSEIDSEPPPAAVVHCREFVGRALQLTLQQRWVKNDLFEVFEVDQQAFKDKHWVITSPEQVRISAKLQNCLLLSDVASVRQGMVTGADSVFVRDVADVPRKDRSIWIPFLRDRNMRSYAVPDSTHQVVFFPYEGNTRLKEEGLKARYTDTWGYLQDNRQALKSRKSVASGGITWWEPVRPRTPDTMMCPKLVSPHLVLKPRFALDTKGKYAVSRCPFIIAKSNTTDDLGLLKFLLGVLNSAIGHWQLITFSHKYSRGYAMLEAKTLSDVRIPNAAEVAPKVMRRIQSLVDKLIADSRDAEAQRELDKHVADLFGFTTKERTEIGMGE